MRYHNNVPLFLIRVGYSVLLNGKWWLVTERATATSWHVERKERGKQERVKIIALTKYIEDVRIQRTYVPVHIRLLDPKARLSAPVDIATLAHRKKLSETLKTVSTMKRYAQKMLKQLDQYDRIIRGQTATRNKNARLFRVTDLVATT